MAANVFFFSMICKYMNYCFNVCLHTLVFFQPESQIVHQTHETRQLKFEDNKFTELLI